MGQQTFFLNIRQLIFRPSNYNKDVTVTPLAPA